MDPTQPLEIRRQVQAARVAYLEGEVAELEKQMALLRRDLTLLNWQLSEAIIEQAKLERQG